MPELNIGLSSWIIQDGNYDDFSVGDRTQFALEFYHATPLVTFGRREKRMTNIAAETYDVTASVIYLDESVWVLDAGIRSYREDKPPADVRAGDFVEGRISVGIDPYFYKEELRGRPGMPNLTYDVEVLAISLETTPMRKVAGVMQRDGERSFISVNRTNAWTDDDGNANYVLRCLLGT